MEYSKTESFNRVLIYIFACTCFLQAQVLKVNIWGLQVAVNRIFIVLFLIAFLFVMLNKHKITIPQEYCYRFIMIWIVWQAVNFAQGCIRNLSGWLKLTWLIMIYMACAFFFQKNIRKKGELYKLFGFLQIGIFIQLLIGLFEHITGIYYWTSYKGLYTTAVYYINKKYPCAMQTNPNDFALLMFFGVFISLAFIKIYHNRMMKLMSLFLILAGIYLIIISDSRSSLLGLIVGLVYVFFPHNRIKKMIPANKLLMVVLIVIVALGFVCFKSVSLVELFSGKLKFTISSGNSEQTRLSLIQNSIIALGKSFGFGIGWHGIAWHNFLFEILAESGIIVFFCYIGFWISLFRGINRITKCSNDANEIIVSKVFAGMIIGSMIAFIGPASVLNIEWVGAVVSSIMLFANISIRNAVSDSC